MMRRAFWILGMMLLLLALPRQAYLQEGREDPFAVRYSDAVRRVHPGDVLELQFDFKIPQNYYLYDEKTTLLFNQTQDLRLLKSLRPDAEDHYDPFFKKNVKVHFHDFKQTLYFQIPESAQAGRRTLEAQLKYQGCSDDFCYRPVNKIILIPVEVVPQGAALIPPKTSERISELSIESRHEESAPSLLELLRENNPDRLLNQGRVRLLALALLGGIFTSFTPCVLPIIPLTLAFIGVRKQRRGNLFRAFMLVLGMVITYAILGFLAATLGLKLGFLFQSRLFIFLMAIFFLIFSLGLFEVIPFHLPSSLQQRFVRWGGEGPFGAFLAGCSVGLIASPCVGPLIGPLLLFAAKTQDQFYGFLLLLNYGVGMGLVFLVLASGFAELSSKLKSGPWTQFLKKALGVLMLAPALYYGYIFAQPYFKASQQDSLWIRQFDRGLETALSTGKPILLDYYADWCPPCLELDKRTFSDPEVRKLGQSFVMLKIDCSTDDDNCQRATERFEVVGWPTILFLDHRGHPIEGVKWIGGFANKEQMLSLMRQALERVGKAP